MKGSFTVEAVFIVPVVVFVLIFGLKTGLDLHQETCLAVENMEETEKVDAVKLFWRASRLEQVKELVFPDT